MTPDRSPTLAALLGLLVPGAGQWYAGRPTRALVWFAAATALTAIGWALAGPVLLAQSRTEVSLAGLRFGIPFVLPELVNLLETLVAQAWLAKPGSVHPDMVLPATAPLGFALTSAAAVMHVCAAAEANWLCRGVVPAHATFRSPGVAALLAWAIPGLGHWWLGRRGKGALAGTALVATFLLGIALAHGTVVQRMRDVYFWSGEIFLGLPAAVATVLVADRRVQQELPLAELGLLCVTVAGLLNVLLMLDAYASAERDLLPTPPSSDAGAVAPGTSTRSPS